MLLWDSPCMPGSSPKFKACLQVWFKFTTYSFTWQTFLNENGSFRTRKGKLYVPAQSSWTLLSPSCFSKLFTMFINFSSFSVLSMLPYPSTCNWHCFRCEANITKKEKLPKRRLKSRTLQIQSHNWLQSWMSSLGLAADYTDCSPKTKILLFSNF